MDLKGREKCFEAYNEGFYLPELKILLKNAVEKNETKNLVKFFNDSIIPDLRELNTKNIEKAIVIIKQLVMDDINVEAVIYKEKFRRLCNISILCLMGKNSMPFLMEVHGGYLLEIYQEQPIVYKLQKIEDEDVFVTRKRREESISGYKKKLKSWWDIDIANYKKEDFNRFCDMMEYIEYDVDNAWERKSKKVNIFLALKKPFLELFSPELDNDYKIQPAKKAIVILLTEVIKHCSDKCIQKYALIKYYYGKLHQLLNNTVYNLVDKMPAYEDMHYSSDEGMAYYYLAFLYNLDNITLNFRKHGKNNESLFEAILLNLLKEQIKIKFQRERMLFQSFSAVLNPLSDRQKEAFVKLYSFNEPDIKIENIENEIKKQKDIVQDFLGGECDLDKLLKRSNRLFEKSVRSKLVMRHKYDGTWNFGHFLALMQIVYTQENTEIEFKSYGRKRGTEKKELGTIIHSFDDNNTEEVHEFLNLLIKQRYGINIGWSKSYPLVEACRLKAEEITVCVLNEVGSWDDSEEAISYTLDIIEAEYEKILCLVKMSEDEDICGLIRMH